MSASSVADLFGIRFPGSGTDRSVVPSLSGTTDPLSDELKAHIPDPDPNYVFEPTVTRSLLAGFGHNRRVMVHGPHGTGKSTHVEQVAARLGWPLLRINLDGHITRMDLVGRDAIVVRDGLQVTAFQEGLLPWAIQRPVALLFDEFDAGRPDVMFVIQRLLERDGRFTLLDQNRVLTPHPDFRLFATTNTVGLGDLTGLYRGTNVLNQAQIDRWNIVAHLDYMAADVEANVVGSHVPELANRSDADSLIESLVAVAQLTRVGYAAGDISTVMSPRTSIFWAENILTFHDVRLAFELSFLNKCDEAEKAVVDEYYQRVFG